MVNEHFQCVAVFYFIIVKLSCGQFSKSPDQVELKSDIFCNTSHGIGIVLYKMWFVSYCICMSYIGCKMNLQFDTPFAFMIENIGFIVCYVDCLHEKNKTKD
jgi:hypothetical protein